ncbi:ACT domain-containing protein [Rheinheimera sp. 1928-s]|uniref:ACT domain-containing protein n=1 Tax=Rheinheimera sp. 1928-s TaxID=3033803 RepID=UPI002619E4F4|nr:ACT domain-containing protein [Rheinheimera sp. 1928-s]MDF3126820.1 ACT domain-containing protein [Rheinheimera sp. 1928-s]
MTVAIQALDQLLSTMQPTLEPEVYVYCIWPLDKSWHGPLPLATFKEKEGLTLVLTEQQATEYQLDVLFRARWISLTVFSDLEAVGLTAAFSTALAASGLSCNVFAGAFHDHILVPVHQAEAAMQALQQLQQSKIQ